jgi:hypothetical protein
VHTLQYKTEISEEQVMTLSKLLVEYGYMSKDASAKEILRWPSSRPGTAGRSGASATIGCLAIREALSRTNVLGIEGPPTVPEHDRHSCRHARQRLLLVGDWPCMKRSRRRRHNVTAECGVMWGVPFVPPMSGFLPDQEPRTRKPVPLHRAMWVEPVVVWIDRMTWRFRISIIVARDAGTSPRSTAISRQALHSPWTRSGR